MTEWRRVVGHPDYEVSDAGEVRSWMPYRGTPVPRLLRPCRTRKGREQVDLCGGAGRVKRAVHLLVAEAFLGPRPEGAETRHLNGDHTDNRLANLAYGTRSDNSLDAVAHGTHAMAARGGCPQGHDYSEENTAHRSTGRKCRQCERDNARKRRIKQEVEVA